MCAEKIFKLLKGAAAQLLKGAAAHALNMCRLADSEMSVFRDARGSGSQAQKVAASACGTEFGEVVCVCVCVCVCVRAVWG